MSWLEAAVLPLTLAASALLIPVIEDWFRAVREQYPEETGAIADER
jgi:peptidoglycan/LPS O-acetylase OafA/YrhL